MDIEGKCLKKPKDRTGFLSTLKDRLLMRMREQD